MVYNAFSHVTYLFRNASFSDRAFIQGFHSAEEDSIDVVYIGGSNVYCYYDPMIAWNEYGIISYCYSVPQMDAVVMLSAVRDIYKDQSPKLVICDVRKFLSGFWYDEITMGVREVLDSYDIGIERLMMVDYYKKISGMSVEEAMSEYLDLIYYHTNYDVLSSPTNWALIKNRVEGDIEWPGNIFKGYRPSSPDGVTAFWREYGLNKSEERKSLLEQSERCLRDLIEYCGKKGINLLLVESPYIIQNENDIAETNTISDIVKEYSVPFLNYNAWEMYETLNLDFATDIYDCNHVNCLGSKKYTEHIAPYMKENYSLVDHRESEEYASWDRLYTEKYLPYMTEYVRTVSEKALGVEQTLEKEPRIRATEDILEWLSLIKDPNITLLYSYVPYEEPDVKNDIYAALYAFDIEQSESCVGVCTDGKASVYTDRQSFSGEIDMPTGIPDLNYSVALNESESVISVDKSEYRHENHKGIYAIAFNNNTAEVVDAITIYCQNGKAKLTHME